MFCLYKYVTDKPRKLVLGSFPAIHSFDFPLKEAYMDSGKIVALTLKFDSMFKLDFVRTITDLAHESELYGSKIFFPPMDPPHIVKPAFTDFCHIKSPSVKIQNSRFYKYLESYKRIKEETSTPLIASLTGPLTILGSIIPYEKLKDKLYSKEYLEIENGLKVVSSLSLSLIERLNLVSPEIFMISDPLACFLEPEAFKNLLIPHYNLLFNAFSGSTILHICGDVASILPFIDKINCSGFSLDEKTNIEKALREISEKTIVFGNISPIDILVNGLTQEVQKETKYLNSLTKKYRNFVPAPGCTLPHYTPIANIKTFLGQE